MKGELTRSNTEKVRTVPICGTEGSRYIDHMYGPLFGPNRINSRCFFCGRVTTWYGPIIGLY